VQLGRLRTESDPSELRSLVRQVRHQAKRRGLLPGHYDRSHREHTDARQGRSSGAAWQPQGQTARKLRQASRGTDREAAELRELRRAPELAPTDPRRTRMGERFSVLSRKQLRRAAFRRATMLADPDGRWQPGHLHSGGHAAAASSSPGPTSCSVASPTDST
jgi:hypothetical protein